MFETTSWVCALVLEVNVDALQPWNFQLVDVGVGGAQQIAGDTADCCTDPVVHRVFLAPAGVNGIRTIV